ncbi:imidazolonepropionase-like amidohydrolase [Anseongella ginsenosidimutans]|uniref:Imidazolonepropionase-like amidohydrolase n=2 Tax=Anseongella ginsenosidimutans TaxID=496056 RepID=A0A4R3KMU9_9SPHI|nr:amidohydrolase family protein [Anseongella ginsenosidimutans]TCS85680.1 imidazolonepropionase-like amidohydrolase [Anseongella ginsenosidimutans]
MLRYCIAALLLVISLPALAQPTIIPAPSQEKPVLITGAMIHVGNGKVIENGAILFADGKITGIGTAGSLDAPGATIIDAAGKHVYPGFIACHSIMGLAEVEAVRATRDFNETGSLNPNVRAIVAYEADSYVPATVRSNGVLLAQVAPQGGVISGTSSVVMLDAWHWEDAAYKMDGGLWISWPGMSINAAAEDEEREKQREQAEKSLSALKEFFRQAKAYGELSSPAVKNLRFEAIKGIFTGEKQLFIRAGRAKDILAAVNWSRSLNIRPVIYGGNEAHLVAEFLKENQVPVILGDPHSLPARDDDDVNLPYKRAALLKEADVQFCISTWGYWQLRNLPFMAGTTAAYGLSPEEALSAITLEPARILGIEASTGSLETGKDATLFISAGDALDMRGNQVEAAFIRGRKIDLDNKQKQLYRKYTEKYGQ